MLLIITSEMQINNYQQFRQEMNRSFKYFKKSQNISKYGCILVVSVLNNQFIKLKDVSSIWTERYIKSKSNFMELLFQ